MLDHCHSLRHIKRKRQKGWLGMTTGGSFKTLVYAAAASAILVACSDTNSRRIDDLDGYTPYQIFELGEYDLANGNYNNATYYFAEVERLFPYSEMAKRGLIMQAFAFHQDQNYEGSRAAAQRYVDFYPADQDAAYAQYLLALSYYDQIEDVGRDQGVTIDALQALRVVFEQYPESEYAPEAKLKFDLAFNHLAGKEMEVGRYYLRRGHYGSAIKRFRKVVEDFQTTSHTAEALHRLVESYVSLGLLLEAQSAAAILGHNYQSSDWYQASYDLLQQQGLSPNAVGNNWLSQIYRQVVQGKWL